MKILFEKIIKELLTKNQSAWAKSRISLGFQKNSFQN